MNAITKHPTTDLHAQPFYKALIVFVAVAMIPSPRFPGMPLKSLNSSFPIVYPQIGA